MLANADARLAEYLAELAKADDRDGGRPEGGSPVRNLAEKIATLQKRHDEYAAIAAELERTGESQVSLTDPDSRAMATYPKVGVGYNAQVAVRRQAPAHRRTGSHQPGQRPGPTRTHGHPRPKKPLVCRDDPGQPPTEDITRAKTSRRARRQASWPSCPSPLGAEEPAASNGRFAKEAFLYDAAADVYRCPQRRDLVAPRRVNHARATGLLLYYHPTDRLPTLSSQGAVHLQQPLAAHRPLGGLKRY